MSYYVTKCFSHATMKLEFTPKLIREKRSFRILPVVYKKKKNNHSCYFFDHAVRVKCDSFVNYLIPVSPN